MAIRVRIPDAGHPPHTTVRACPHKAAQRIAFADLKMRCMSPVLETCYRSRWQTEKPLSLNGVQAAQVVLLTDRGGFPG